MAQLNAAAILAVVLIVAIVVFALVRWRGRGVGAAAGLLAAGAVGGARGRSDAGKGAPPVRWDGPAGCYPPALVAGCLRYVRAMPGFGPVTEAERARLAGLAAELAERHKVAPGVEQLVSMRRMEAGLASQRSGARALQRGEAIAAEYHAGDPVLAIAARHRLPPLAVLRQVLLESGLSAAQVRDAIAEPSRLPPRLAAEAPAIAAADIGSRQNAEAVRAEAQAYEDAVGAHLRALGLDFDTEADIRARPTAAGDPPLTPDFLIRGPPAMINGRRVHWLDAKNYPALDSPLVMRSLRKQVKKYTARLGEGALIFNGGTTCGSETSRLGALVLDGSHIVRGAP